LNSTTLFEDAPFRSAPVIPLAERFDAFATAAEEVFASRTVSHRSEAPGSAEHPLEVQAGGRTVILQTVDPPSKSLLVTAAFAGRIEMTLPVNVPP
jgi:hypothetical protein